ncbi:hypothetical protein SAMN05445504_2353 [Burkholderia sp. CF099]|nr:hypothetical protein SAMN05445504_2353 [Burkholderia sp. CF099]
MQHSDAPWKALKRAEEAFGELKADKSPEDNADSWQDFLIHIERTWNRAEAHFAKSPKWNGWKSKYENLRKQDPLLSYVRHARNADEHSTQSITKAGPKGIGINPAVGNRLHLKNMHIGKGKISFETDIPVSIKIIHGEARAVDVIDRSVQYPVPNSHLGKGIDPKLATMAELVLDFYKDTLTAAEDFFVK